MVKKIAQPVVPPAATPGDNVVKLDKARAAKGKFNLTSVLTGGPSTVSQPPAGKGLDAILQSRPSTAVGSTVLTGTVETQLPKAVRELGLVRDQVQIKGAQVKSAQAFYESDLAALRDFEAKHGMTTNKG
jgi:hypothetical protein